MHQATMPATNQLTPRQLQLLRAIASSLDNHCYSPTIAELAEQLSISRSTAFEHIAELRRKKLLRASPGRARSLRPTSKAQKLLRTIDDPRPPTLHTRHKSVPLLGCVAAGAPIQAIENPESLSLESYFGIDDNTFALEVRGDSMIDDDIHDGDYVICQRASTAANGQLVVALIDNENATLKRFYKEDSCIRLDPANQEYEPIYSRHCRIEALVIGLVRKL